MLQAYGLEPGEPPALLAVTNPELITSIHRQYVEAGADILYANTFGTNRYKLEGYGYSPGQIIDSAIKAARAACKEDTLVALDVDPLGELLEPMGTLTFEEAYDAFCEVVKQGEASGADLIVIETMTDLYEVKAAVLAAKEQTNLPVMVSMTFEETGRTFTGTSIECMTAVLEGLGVDAVGINCSLGPVEIFPLAEKMCQLTDLPVFVKPNAGLPDPRTGAYTIGPEEFARAMAEYRHLGIAMAGGCCGTTPDYIARMKAVFAGMERKQRTPSARESCVCSATNCVAIDHVTVIGERINPTGKKRLKQALIEEDYDYLYSRRTPGRRCWM